MEKKLISEHIGNKIIDMENTEKEKQRTFTENIRKEHAKRFAEQKEKYKDLLDKYLGKFWIRKSIRFGEDEGKTLFKFIDIVEIHTYSKGTALFSFKTNSVHINKFTGARVGNGNWSFADASLEELVETTEDNYKYYETIVTDIENKALKLLTKND